MHHVVRRDHDLFLFTLLPPLAQNCVELFFRVFLCVPERSRFFKILRLDRTFFFQPDTFNFLLDLFNIGWARHRIDAGARPGFIHDVDGLVRKKAAGDVTIRKSDRGLERFIGEFCLVVRLIFRTQTFQNLDCFIHRGRIDFYRLEAAFERGVLLDVFTVLVHGRCADTLKFSATQGGFDDVRSIHRALG